MKMVSTEQSPATQFLNAKIPVLMSAVLLVVYIAVEKVWVLSDVWVALRGIAFLWLPVGLFLFVILRDECTDAVEAAFLSAVGSLTLATAVMFAADTASIGWSGAKHAIWVVPVALLVTAMEILRRRATGLNPLIDFRRCRPDWMLVTLVLSSLCVTARYQRPFEAIGDAGDVRYLLNGDQMYFASLAQELTRGTPPADCPIRSGLRERAYHNLPHYTLSLVARTGGQPDLLRCHLVVGYSVLVVLCCGLVYCLARELGGGRGAGMTGLWLLFVGAIPAPVLWSNDIHLFQVTLWSQSNSTVEPTLLTSPQMFYGMAISYGVLLGLLRVFRSHQAGRSCVSLGMLTAILAALLLRFRVQSFLIIFALVCGAFVVLTWRHRRWSLLGALGLATVVVALQVGEMKLPAYLPASHELQIGNNGVGFVKSFFRSWPGSEVCFELLLFLLGDTHLFGWSWQFLTLSMFVVFNILGPAMLVALAIFVRGAWRSPQDRGIVYGLVFLIVVALLGAATLAVDYDGYSLGGQILLQLGWLALPCVAVSAWRMIERFLDRAKVPNPWRDRWFCLLTLVVVAWQMFRPPSSCQKTVCGHSAIITVDEVSAWEFCRRELPANAVLLTNQLENNMAKWSGMAARRTYLDYVPGSNVLDPLFPAEESVESRTRLIRQLFATTNDERFEQLLRSTSVTHVVEFRDTPLHVTPAAVIRPVWRSRNQLVTIWQVDR